MSKLAIYRNNSAYEQFLAPALAVREGFEVQVFPQGTSEMEITTWLAEHADQIRSMEKVYMDLTCYKAGEVLPSAERPDNSNWNIWMDVSTNYGGFGQDFREAARSVMTKATVEETVTEIVRHMLAKEVPDKVFVAQNHMGDHDLLGSGSLSAHGDWERASREDAEKLRLCLEIVTGKPVAILEKITCTPSGCKPLWERASGDTTWVFFDRHFRTCTDYKGAKSYPGVQWFRVPIENLIEDALAFGIVVDTEAYSHAIREEVATW